MTRQRLSESMDSMSETKVKNLKRSAPHTFSSFIYTHQAVQRIAAADLTPEIFYRQFRKPAKPVVITGVLSESLQRSQQWTLESMRKVIGEQAFTIRYYGKGHFDTPKHQWQKYSDFRSMSFNDYAAMLESGEAQAQRAYLAQMPIGHSDLVNVLKPILQQFADRYGFQPWITGTDWNIWIGPDGHTEPLHFDNADGTLLQLRGQKRVDLFPSHLLKELYPFNFYAAIPPWVSRVNLEAIDYDIFPAMRKAECYWQQAILDEGDILYIPIGWWHEVTGQCIHAEDKFVCSMNRFWRPRPLLNNFPNRRVGLFYFVNKLPWEQVIKLDTSIRGLRSRLREALTRVK